MGRHKTSGFGMETAERFLCKVFEPPQGCWEWQAGKNRLGYGKFSWGGREAVPELAHRIYYALLYGDLPKQLNHRCNNPCCCRPDHLYEGGKSENLYDAVANGTHAMTRKTACKWGHLFTPDNTRRRKDGGRDCLTCCRRRSKEWELRHRIPH